MDAHTAQRFPDSLACFVIRDIWRQEKGPFVAKADQALAKHGDPGLGDSSVLFL
ncbi:hypothetical protein D3C87_1896750 [compost metagenome]